MTVEQDNFIEQIAHQILCVSDEEFLALQNTAVTEDMLKKYGKAFSDSLDDLCPKISIGLKIGLTKRFLEFTAKNISSMFSDSDERELEHLFNKLVYPVSQKAADLENSDIVVYVIYRETKKTIDDICNEYKNSKN